ncbi:MAG TPA: hypothetical protein VH306_10575 [Gaiellaceae bacterium]
MLRRGFLGVAALGIALLSAAGAGGQVAVDPPTITMLEPASSPTNDQIARFEFSGGDTFRCALDDAELMPCDATQQFGPLPEGTHTIHARATVGSDESAENTRTWRIDLTDPTVTITSPATNERVFRSRSIALTFHADEDVSFECSLDGSSTFSPCQSPKSTPDLDDGGHNMRVRATDDAGNTSDVETRTWRVNHTPPAKPVITTHWGGDHQVVFKWTNPTAPDFQAVVIKRGTKTIFVGTKTKFIDHPAWNGRVYHYTMWSRDTAGNTSARIAMRIRPRGHLFAPADGRITKKLPTLRWRRVANAGYYNVLVQRNGVVIFSRWPKANSLRMPRHWHYHGRVFTLKPARYDWFVYPHFSSGYPKNPLGRATFFKR